MIANWKLKPIPSWRPSRYTEDGRCEISESALYSEHLQHFSVLLCNRPHSLILFTLHFTPHTHEVFPVAFCSVFVEDLVCKLKQEGKWNGELDSLQFPSERLCCSAKQNYTTPLWQWFNTDTSAEALVKTDHFPVVLSGLLVKSESKGWGRKRSSQNLPPLLQFGQTIETWTAKKTQRLELCCLDQLQRNSPSFFYFLFFFSLVPFIHTIKLKKQKSIYAICMPPTSRPRNWQFAFFLRLFWPPRMNNRSRLFHWHSIFTFHNFFASNCKKEADCAWLFRFLFCWKNEGRFATKWKTCP